MKRIALTLLAACAALSVAARPAETPPGSLNLIPQPASVVLGEGVFALKDGMRIGVQTPALQAAADYLCQTLQETYGLRIVSTANLSKADITLALTLKNTNPEAYALTVDRKGIVVQGAGSRGVVLGLAALRQLLPLGSNDLRIPCMTINDAPRFAWRGMHLDVSRHFFTIDQVKTYIDLMAVYKFNKFHWHLTDDQGWRIEIKQYPELTARGAWRKFDRNDRDCIASATREDNPDMLIPEELTRIENGDTLYGGFYTQEQIRDVVSYAGVRGIDVIPEIDMPGHLMAAEHGYPWISCFGEAAWGASFSSPLCPGKDSALVFAKNIYSEVFGLFPYEYVHLGADEVEKTNWKKCPLCQARIQALGLKDEKELQAWFVHQMEAHFNANGRKLIGWDEIEEGGLSSTATVMWWRDWAPQTIPLATAAGNKVILTPDFLLYLDFLEMKGDVERIYRTEPATYHSSWQLTPDQEKNLWGVQGNVWCERIPSFRRMQYQVMPRMLALAELAWIQPAQKNWEEFRNRMVFHVGGRLDPQGVNYRIPDFTGFRDINVFVDTAWVTVHNILPRVEVRYTTDGSYPQITSPLYTSPISITESANFTFRGFRPDGTAGAIQRAEYRKEDYALASELIPQHEGIRAVYYQYRGRRCADIDKAKEVRSYTLSEVAIPEDATGWVGLVYEGYIQVKEDGIYTFSLTSNDGSMLHIDNAILIDNDGPHGDTEKVAERALAKGWHKVRVEYFDQRNGGMLSLKMATQATPELKTITEFNY